MTAHRMTPDAVTVTDPGAASPYLLLCEHASNFIPPGYAGLGLPAADLVRHIAWDPGAAPLARLLARGLGATLIQSGFSRLLVDCNRPLHSTSLIPTRSEDTEIPGNAALTAAERAHRIAAYHAPFQSTVAAELDRRTRLRIPTIVFGVHSFTPVFQGFVRPWHVGLLYAEAAPFARAAIARLAEDPALVVGDNEPYTVDRDHDHTVPVHGDDRGIPAALLEVRQDLLATTPDIEGWAARLLPILAALATHARPPA